MVGGREKRSVKSSVNSESRASVLCIVLVDVKLDLWERWIMAKGTKGFEWRGPKDCCAPVIFVLWYETDAAPWDFKEEY